MHCVFFDTETGGLEVQHPTIQVAALAVEDWNVVGEFEAKIQFSTEACEPEALNVNSYDAATWSAHAVTPSLALTSFCDFLRSHSRVEKISKAGRPYCVARLAGHNISTFDMPRLQADCKRLGLFLPADFHGLDTLELAKWYFQFSNNRPADLKLATLAKWFGVSAEDAHDAMGDCHLALSVARQLASRFYLP